MKLVRMVLPKVAKQLDDERTDRPVIAAVLTAVAVLVIIFVAFPAGGIELLVRRLGHTRRPPS